MISSGQLVSFFRSELDSERNFGWPRLRRIPDTLVWRNLKFYDTLNTSDREALLDSAAELAGAYYGFVFGLPARENVGHPILERWRNTLLKCHGFEFESVPTLRLAIAQFRADIAKNKQSSVSQGFFNYALSVRGVQAPELRKGVKNVFSSIGLQKVQKTGGGNYVYHCELKERFFQVWINYGGRSKQLRYCVVLPEFKDVDPLFQFRLERAFAFGFGDWNCITEENFNDSLQMLCEAVCYSIDLPKRIKEHAAKLP
jgi:hypothetical protein